MKNTFLNLDSALQGSMAILLASVLWGTTGTAASLAPDVSAFAIGACSTGFGGLLLAFIARDSLRADKQQLIAHRKVLFVGAIALAVYPLAFYSSMRFAGVAIGTVVSIASAPFMTALIERRFGTSQVLTSRWVLSIMFGTVGIALLTFSEASHESLQLEATQIATSQMEVLTAQQSNKLIGVLLGLLAALSYATYAWVAQRLIEQNVQSESAMGAIFGLGALILLPTLVFTGDHLLSSLNNIAVVTYMALIPMFLGYVVFGFGLRHINASKATLLTLFEPVVAACFAVWIVGEVITPVGWLGMALIMICLLLQATERAKPQHSMMIAE
ncbi:DMT family transporter [Enterovibrio calviensis]|uniref:DMT family transporter n=1 Tax=Enterovibrio calviensis TaxID=91359 RepID=UPI00047F7450|nr:EamA family transporter [Enterovibrio calviensis]